MDRDKINGIVFFNFAYSCRDLIILSRKGQIMNTIARSFLAVLFGIAFAGMAHAPATAAPGNFKKCVVSFPGAPGATIFFTRGTMTGKTGKKITGLVSRSKGTYIEQNKGRYRRDGGRTSYYLVGYLAGHTEGPVKGPYRGQYRCH